MPDEGQAVILYPDGARSLGALSEVLRSVPRQRDCSRPDYAVAKFVISAEKAIVLAEQLSDAVEVAIKGCREASMGIPPDAFEPVFPGLDASKNKSAPKQQSRKRRSSRSLRLMLGTPCLNKRRKVRTSSHSRRRRRSMLLLRLKSNSASRVQENRTWLAFHGRLNWRLLEPKVEREKELGHVEVREREDPEVRV